MPRTIKRLTVNIMVLVLIFSLVILAQPQPAEAATYNDIGSHWARDAIVRWEALGALADFPSGPFRPDTPITRAEFFSILVRALGATEQGDISQFTDVDPEAWYYDIVSLASKMRLASGTSETTMSPTSNIIRQDAATLVARAMGIATEGDNYLYRYSDRENISGYARDYVSAVTEHGYMSGSYGNFNPRANLSRAEAVKIVDNLFTHYYRPEVGFDNLTLTGNVMSNRTESVFNNLTLNGDLILADGVGVGDATLNDCVINGRLVLRGGGPNSVVLNNTYVSDGVTVISPSSQPRIVTSESTSVPQVTAFSGFTLTGTGVRAVTIADDAFANITATLDGVVLDNLTVGGLGAKVDILRSKINNLYVGGAADNAAVSLDKDVIVDYMSTVAPYTALSGAGKVGDAFLNAPGAVLSMTPDTYTVGVNLTATIGGQVVNGQILDTANTMLRDASNLNITQDSSYTGGENLSFRTVSGRSANTVTVSQDAHTELPLDLIDGRYGYFIGFFIPAPSGYGDQEIPQVSYSESDGGMVTMTDVALTRKGGVYGLEFYLPVTCETGAESGKLFETMDIQWSSQVSEHLQFHSGWMTLESPSSSQETRMVENYEQSRFDGLDGASYDGADALRRLLVSDNPLGLDTKGFAAFSVADQEDLAARLYEYTSHFTSRDNIQSWLDQVLDGKGALYAVNNAVTVEMLRNALENKAFAKDLNIDLSANSAYAALSEAGRQRVVSNLLAGRTKEFANAAAVKTAFDKAVVEARTSETSLLVSLNTAKTAADIQKLIENKNNADALGFAPGDEPYKSCPKDLKLELAQRIVNNRSYYSVDEAARVIDEFLITVEESGVEPDFVLTVNSVTVTTGSNINVATANITMLPGDESQFTFVVNTSSGTFVTLDRVDITWTNPNVIEVEELGDRTGVIVAKVAGSAKVTITSKDDPKKSASINVTVKNPVPATAVKLDKTSVEIGAGESTVWLNATMTPTSSTDSLIWSAANDIMWQIEDANDNENVVKLTVSGNGSSVRLTGVNPGVATVTVRTSSNQTATCTVTVYSKNPGVSLNYAIATIGVGQFLQLQATVSPIANRNNRVTWDSTDKTVATVDSFGKVTGLVAGTSTITATTVITSGANAGTYTATCEVTVDPNIKILSLNRSKIIMGPTGVDYLTATVTPKKADDDVDKDVILWGMRGPSGVIDDNIESLSDITSKITAKGAGTVYVFAYLRDDPSAMAECEVQVLTAVPKVTASPARLSLYVGQTDVITASFNPNTITNKNIKWVSSDEAVATVDSYGRVTAVSTQGLATAQVIITGEPEADSTATPLKITVTVTQVPVTSFYLDKTHLYLTLGNDGRLLSELFTIGIGPDNATYKNVRWSSTDLGYVTVAPTFIDNNTISPDDIYGGQRLSTVATTFYEDVIGKNPDGSSILGPIRDHPITLTATALGASSSVKPITVQVTVYPSTGSGQVNNIKINLNRWVYPLNYETNLSVLWNVIGRTGNTWTVDTANQPSNRNVIWESTDPAVATIEGGRLKTLRQGYTTIIATAEDGGIIDQVGIVVEPDGISSMSFPALNMPGFDPNLHLYVGESDTVSPVISPGAAANRSVSWLPYEWFYDDDTQPNGYPSDSITSGNTIISISNGKITGLKPGLVRVTVQPTDIRRTDTLTLDELKRRCLDSGLTVAGGDVFKYFLDLNHIDYSRIDSETSETLYYSPNEMLMNIPGIARRPIDPAGDSLTLVVPRKVDGNQFFVWVSNPLLQSVAITNAPGEEREPLQTIRFTAQIDPLLTDVKTITWNYDAKILTLTDTSTGLDRYDPLTGLCYANFEVNAGVLPANYNVSVTVTSAADYGLKPDVNNPGLLQQVQDAVTVNASYLLKVIASAFSASSPSAQSLDARLSALGMGYMLTEPSATTGGDSTAAAQSATQTTTAPTVARRVSVNLATGWSSLELTRAARAEALPSSAVFASSNTAVAVVSPTGIITAVAPGSATITATANNRAVAADVTVNYAANGAAAAKSMTMRQTANVVTGQSIVLIPWMGTGYDLSSVSWSSANSGIAKVDANGVVSGVKAGKVVITATVPNTKLKATCTVTVSDAAKVPLTGISLSKSNFVLEAGKAAAISVSYLPTTASLKGVSWYSSDTSVAVVNQSGAVTGITDGTVTISAVADEGGHIATCTVGVTTNPVRVTGISLSQTALTLTVGEQYTLNPLFAPSDATNQNASWTSSNRNVVTVDNNGQLKAVRKGTSTITITTSEGNFKATCRVTVK